MKAAACGSRSRHCSNSIRRAKSPNHSSRPATSSMDNASSTSMMGCPNGRGTNMLRKRSAVELPASVCGSPSLDPRPQHDFERPSRAMLTMELQISFGDVVRVGHIVVDTCGPQKSLTLRQRERWHGIRGEVRSGSAERLLKLYG